MKILMSAYACEPGKGSEPGVGWNWALAMAKSYNVTVFTRSNNQQLIDCHWQAKESSVKKLEFAYYDLPPVFVRMKKRGVIPVKVYYFLWQAGLSWKMRKAREAFDIIHHVTFNIFTCPGLWWGGGQKIVLGPLGGGICVADEYMPLFGKQAKLQIIRNEFTRRWWLLPTTLLSLNRADIILCANIDTYNLLSERYPEKVKLHLETGIEPPRNMPHRSKSGSDMVEFLVVGSIEARKGWSLAIDAIQLAVSKEEKKLIRLVFVGDGPELELAKARVKERNLAEYVKFLGRLSHEKTKEKMSQTDVLLFPSVRDTSGNVVLEAMALKIPVVCISHQGVAEITSPDCAIRIPPSTIEQTVENIADAMMLLSKDEDMRIKMGNSGYKRIQNKFTWKSKAKFMSEIYES